MISPFTGTEAYLKSERRTIVYRKRTYDYIAPFYEDSQGNRFTTTELDEISFAQVTNKYRAEFHIPYTDEIIALRSKYGLSAIKMSKVLGFGDNQYRLYEDGDVPSVANGKTITACSSPSTFEAYVRMSYANVLSDKEYNAVLTKIEQEKQKPINYLSRLIFSKCGRCADNGFAPQSTERLRNLLVFFICNVGNVFATKMNKLLFYTDFVNYRSNGQAISGLSYLAAPFGPTPYGWSFAYSAFPEIHNEIEVFAAGIEGTKLVTSQKPDLSIFSDTEKKSILDVANKFKRLSANEISELSHKESAWLHNITGHRIISFDEAFNLVAI